jgi:ribulose-phosphate 3-epimerase
MVSSDILHNLPFARPEILPSVLVHTVEEYCARLEQLEQAGTAWAQVDIGDGKFVPNRTVLPNEIREKQTSLHLEAHLMVFEPEIYLEDLKSAGFNRVLLHRESFETLSQCSVALHTAREVFGEVGLVINPDTPVEDYHDLPITVVQCMGVRPGFSGQPMLESIYDTIALIRQQKIPLVLAADGGINEENIQILFKAGVSRFIMASAVFNGQRPIQQTLQQLISLLSPGGV